jgi:peroxiredoxin
MLFYSSDGEIQVRQYKAYARFAAELAYSGDRALHGNRTIMRSHPRYIETAQDIMLLQFSSSRSSKWKLAAVAATLTAILIGSAAWFKLTARSAAPSVVFTSLTGQKIPLNTLRGKVVLVNFWATSCTICVHEMPQMVRTYNQFKSRGLEFVAVAMSYDPPNYVLTYAQTRKLPFPVSLDPQDELAQAFGGVNATPTTFLIGKDGKVIKRFQGEPEFRALDQLLEQALAAAG